MPKKGTKTQYSSSTKMTRLGFKFQNKDTNITGDIELDIIQNNNTRLRRAFVKHNFNNFHILIGQEWGLEEINTFSVNCIAVAGLNGNLNRYPQIRLGGKFDLEKAAINFDLSFEYKSWTTYGSGVFFQRRVAPAIAAKVSSSINIGFGKPARIYAFATATPIKLDVHYTVNGIGEDIVSKTPILYGIGFSLPVSIVKLQGEYIHAKGANMFAGLTSRTPASYYLDYKGDLKESKYDAWNIETKLKLLKNAWLSAGYDYVKFRNTSSVDTLKDVRTIFLNTGIMTTKQTILALEWRNPKAKNKDGSDENGNAVFMRYI
jgi:hypothetical protein